MLKTSIALSDTMVLSIIPSSTRCRIQGDDPMKISGAEQGGTVVPDLSQCMLLLVDDAEENLDILVEALGDEVDLTVATDGESALEILEQELPDLILLDIEMPGMDGFEVCRRLKAGSRTEHIPIVFLSGRSDATDKTRAMEMGAADFITKPFVAADVLARVMHVLESRSCLMRK